MNSELAAWFREQGFEPEIPCHSGTGHNSVTGSVLVGELEFCVVDLGDPSCCVKASPGMVCLFSDEWATRREQCTDFIRARLGKFDRRFGARECTVRAVGKTDTVGFFDAYHIQGSNHLGVACFGLFLWDELIGLSSFGRHSRQISENRIVLDRLCFKGGVQVVGGASKLFKRGVAWAQSVGYDEIVSFSDNRWTDGCLYRELGFSLEREYGPDYSYVKDGVRHSKQSQKKQSCGCPESMTELEWARSRGLHRIYDAGKKRWVFNLRPESHETWNSQSSHNCAEQHRTGSFKHSHIRGYFRSDKMKESVYYGSSYELRCLFLLERDETVRAFRRCESFQGEDKWRNPDLWVEFGDGHAEVWEVKPTDMLQNPAVQQQILESVRFAAEKRVPFRVWTEKDSGLSSDHAIVSWARAYLAEVCGDTSYLYKQAVMRKKIRERYYARHVANDHVPVWCDFCKETHTPLRLTYEKNLARNAVYVCERYGGHLAGKKPKLALRQTNPYAAEGKKRCCRCKQTLLFDRFSARKASWDGYTAACKDCTALSKKAARDVTSGVG